MTSQPTEARATLLSGWGYWDTTNYPYGGCFRRATEDTVVTVLGPGGKFPTRERKIRFADGRTAVAETRALRVAPSLDLVGPNGGISLVESALLIACIASLALFLYAAFGGSL
jgi:hypothetical protein